MPIYYANPVPILVSPQTPVFRHFAPCVSLFSPPFMQQRCVAATQLLSFTAVYIVQQHSHPVSYVQYVQSIKTTKDRHMRSACADPFCYLNTLEKNLK